MMKASIPCPLSLPFSLSVREAIIHPVNRVIPNVDYLYIVLNLFFWDAEIVCNSLIFE